MAKKKSGTKLASRKKKKKAKARSRLRPAKKDGRSRKLPGEPGHRFSYSQVSMYLRCAKQYEFAYMKGIRRPPGIALVEGSCHHNALAHNNEKKMKTGKDIKPKTQIDFFMNQFDKSKMTVSDWGGTNENEVANRAKGIIEVYHRDYAPLIIRPTAVEKRYSVEVGGIPFVAFVDLELNINKKKAIRDYKVVARRKSEKEAASDLQLTIYSLITDSEDVGLVCLTKTNVPAVVEVASMRNLSQKKHAVRVVKDVVDSVAKGAFPRCDPTGWICSERFCGFYHECWGIRKKTMAQGLNLRDLKKKARAKG